MRSLLMLLLTSFVLQYSIGQEPVPIELNEPEIFVVVEEQASFPGGKSAMIQYISENFKYPEIALEKGIEGTVILRFVVDESGKIDDIRILKAIGGGCDEAAVALIKAMPDWEPGKNRDIAVNTYYTLPVNFSLNDPEEDIIEEEVTIDNEEEIMTVVQKQPEFPGGVEGLFRYLGENINYPEVAQEHGIQGRVIVKFVVEKDGTIGDISILRDIGGGCGTESVRVVSEMPKWSPGKENGEPVKVYFTLPIAFALEGGTKGKKEKG